MHVNAFSLCKCGEKPVWFYFDVGGEYVCTAFLVKRPRCNFDLHFSNPMNTLCSVFVKLFSVCICVIPFITRGLRNVPKNVNSNSGKISCTNAQDLTGVRLQMLSALFIPGLQMAFFRIDYLPCGSQSL